MEINRGFVRNIWEKIDSFRRGNAPITTPSWEAGTRGMTVEQKEAEAEAFKERLNKYVPMREEKV